MGQTFFCVFLLLSLFKAFGKYVYIETAQSWDEAQNYCRQHHTEFALISGEHDMELLRGLVDEDSYNRSYFWFGMKRSALDKTKWMWSGAGEVSKFFWDDDQPNNGWFEDYGLLHRDTWHDSRQIFTFHSFCYQVFVVRERKTWEGAVRYCREHHKDLASIASKAEMTLILKELDKNDTTDHVWIGLHFFPGDWLWTDGQPMDYEAWSTEGKPACPGVKSECAALKTKDEVQSTNGTNSTQADKTRSFYSGINTWYNTGRIGTGAEEVKERVWEAHDCEEKLYFVCY